MKPVSPPPSRRASSALFPTTAGFAGALRGSQDLTLADHLLAALNSRHIIDHAIGILIGQQHCNARSRRSRPERRGAAPPA